LIIDDNRKLYTRHGLHLNKVGKSVLTSQIARFICAILKQGTMLPIAMDWKLGSDNSMSTGNLLTGDSQNSQFLFSSHEIPVNRKSE
jgi:hypothetical protein